MSDGQFAYTGRRLAVLAVVDNGQYPPEVFEIAILPMHRPGLVDPGALKTWLVRPTRPVTTHATRSVHGITNNEVASAPTWRQVAHDIAAHLNGRAIIAHDAPNTSALVAAHLPDWQRPLTLDTLQLAKNAWLGSVSTGPDQTATQPNLNAQRPPPPRRLRRASDRAIVTAELFADLVHRNGLTWPQIIAGGQLPSP